MIRIAFSLLGYRMRDYRRALQVLLLFSMILFSGLKSSAQMTGAALLEVAGKLYSEGEWEKTIEYVHENIPRVKGASTEEKWGIHRLLAICYHSLGDLDHAEDEVRMMIRLRPPYKPVENVDPSDFILYYKHFTYQTITIGLRGGIISSGVEVVKDYPANGSQYVSHLRPGYGGDFSGLLALSGEFPIFRNFRICGELQYSTLRYNYSDASFPGTQINYKEKTTYLQVPVSVKYLYNIGAFSPFARFGAVYGFLLKSEGEFFTNTQDMPETFVLDEARMKHMLNLQYGLGFSVRMGSNSLSLEARYRQALTNLNNPAKRYSNSVLLQNYLHVDDDIRIGSAEITLTWAYNLFSIQNKNTKIRKWKME